LRYFALNGTDHATHQEQDSMIRRYIIWRNNHAYDERLRRIVARANQLDAALGTGRRRPGFDLGPEHGWESVLAQRSRAHLCR
jgi:hypothetical protein